MEKSVKLVDLLSGSKSSVTENSKRPTNPSASSSTTTGTATQESPQSVAPEGVNPLLFQFISQVEQVCDERYRMHHGDAELVDQLKETFDFLKNRKDKEVLSRIIPVASSDTDAKEANTLIEFVHSDQPFIVDTTRLFFDFMGLRVVSSFYMAYYAERDSDGDLVEIASPRRSKKDGKEMVARFEISGELQPEFRDRLQSALLERLEIARRVVGDFKRMKMRMRSISNAYGVLLDADLDQPAVELIDEAKALIDWILAENFILMGISFIPAGSKATDAPRTNKQYGHANVPDDEKQSAWRKLAVSNQAKSEQEFFADGSSWIIAYKGQEESLIHRAGKIDNFLFRTYNDEGDFEGYYHLRGLFTFKAIQTPGSQIPLVRTKLRELLSGEDFEQGSLQTKSINNAFSSIPVEFLFEAPTEEIKAIVDDILYVEKSKELRTHLTLDKNRRKSLYFLVLPRHGYSEDLRRRIEAVLISSMGATYSDSRVYFGKFDTILLTFFFTASDRFADFTAEDLDETVRAVAGTWEERFMRDLTARYGKKQAQAFFDRYHASFPEEYQLSHTPADTVINVEHLDLLRIQKDLPATFDTFVSDRDRMQNQARLRIYQNKNIYLSSILPTLSNFGLQIIDQSAFRVQPAREKELYIDTFRVAGVDREDHPMVANKGLVIDALKNVFAKRVASDSLNRLIIDVGLGWQDVDLIRAYVSYLRQLGNTTTTTFISKTLRQNRDVTLALMKFYQTRFDPKLEKSLEERQKSCNKIEEEIINLLHAVPSTAQDSFLRQLLNLFKSTLRTNRYQDSGEEHYNAFKIDSEALLMASDPRPWREIYVHHYSVEGIHIRGGQLARGGIRWSDRVNDFREEVLGLMRTQMVKNVLIVPMGAKGGYIVRRPSEDAKQRRVEADELYKIFINGLLDLTDNVSKDGIIPPIDVVRYDEDDPYMVVAADKGTAHLSDTANAISVARGFWLGDAFASGGRHGYDHKALGITAKGAWEGVRRHFREMGMDPDKDVFTTVGIGDMAGDVFGNGMLLSQKIKLLGAFNHMHIFIDPNPDPGTSYAERERMFNLPASSWQDYNAELISRGGGVFERSAKSIQLSSEAMKMFGFEEANQKPDDVIRGILRLKVDLLWNGGIGTYVKASHEDNRDLGDIANQNLRINAKQLRAKVFGEGGNLGISPAGRVEFALRGGRINTDFVDNSGGVDCSDHEVNLKILLKEETEAGRLSFEDRNVLLERLADTVCSDVLNNNYNQGLLLSLDQERSIHDLFSFERTIKNLEDRAIIDRDRDHLPNFESLLRRSTQGHGMTRPELAVLSAYCKMEVYKRLLELPEGAIPNLDGYLSLYFPNEVVDQFGDSLSKHLLGKEIAMTMVTNQIIDHAGATFFFDVERETGASIDQIVRAYLLTDDLYSCWGMKESVTTLDGRVPCREQYIALLAIEEARRRSVCWLLSGEQKGRMERIEEDCERYTDDLHRYEGLLPAELPRVIQKRYREHSDVYYGAGFTIGLPERLARFEFIPAGLRVADICAQTEASVEGVTRLYFQIGQKTHIIPLLQDCDEQIFNGRWDSLSLRIIRTSMLDSLWAITRMQAEQLGKREDGDWVEEGVEGIINNVRFQELKFDMQKISDEEITVASLQVISERLRRVTKNLF